MDAVGVMCCSSSALGSSSRLVCMERLLLLLISLLIEAWRAVESRDSAGESSSSNLVSGSGFFSSPCGSRLLSPPMVQGASSPSRRRRPVLLGDRRLGRVPSPVQVGGGLVAEFDLRRCRRETVLERGRESSQSH